jgi:succinylarginine dihydrolase
VQAVNPAVLMNDTLFATLNDWVDRYYRDRLTQADLADPQLLREGREALDRLTQILQLGSFIRSSNKEASWTTFWH